MGSTSFLIIDSWKLELIFGYECVELSFCFFSTRGNFLFFNIEL